MHLCRNKRHRNAVKALNQGLNEQMGFSVSVIRTAVSIIKISSHLEELFVLGELLHEDY